MVFLLPDVECSAYWLSVYNAVHRQQKQGQLGKLPAQNSIVGASAPQSIQVQ